MAQPEAPKAEKPKRTNIFKQLPSVYKAVSQLDPKVGWWIGGVFFGTMAVFSLIGVLIDHPIYLTVIGLPLALLGATLVLSRRGERAAYRAMEGKPGQTVGALSTIKRGWYFDQEPVAADGAKPNDFANAAMVFRALGKPGVVLFAEGPTARAKKLLEKEQKKVARVAPGVPIHIVHVGDGEGQVAARKLNRYLIKLKPVLTKDEMANVNRRLKSIPGVRQGIPAGVDPTKARMDRRSLRGR